FYFSPSSPACSVSPPPPSQLSSLSLHDALPISVVAVVAAARDDRDSECRHLAVDAHRVPGDVRRLPDCAQRVGRGGTGRWRYHLDAVPAYRAAVPPTPAAARPLLSNRRRDPRLRSRLCAHRRRSRDHHAVPEPLHLSDRLQVLRSGPGVRSGGRRHGGNDRLLHDRFPLLAGGPGMTHRGRRLTRLATTVLLAVIALVFAFPLFYLIATSLKTKADLFEPVPSLFPPNPTIDPYISVLFTRGFGGLLVNSIVVGLSATFVAICVAFAICYPITRLPASPRLRRFVLNWALSLRFLPPVAVVIPYFAIVRTIGLYNQLPALIVVYAIFNLP